MSGTSRSPEQLSYAWRDALVARDAGAFAALFAPDGVMIDVEHRTADLRRARPVRGRAAIEELTVGWLRETPLFDQPVWSFYALLELAAARLRGRSDVLALRYARHGSVRKY